MVLGGIKTTSETMLMVPNGELNSKADAKMVALRLNGIEAALQSIAMKDCPEFSQF